jgi:hypothetical protein
LSQNQPQPHPLDSSLQTIAQCAVNGTFPVAAYNGGKMQLVFPNGTSTNTNAITFAVDDLAEFGRKRSGLNKWKTTLLGSLFPGHRSLNFQSTVGPAIVALGDYNYIFWRDTSGGELAAVRCRPDGTEATVATVAFTAEPSQKPTLTMTATTVMSNPVAIVAPDGEGICLQFLMHNPDQFAQNNVTVPMGASLWISCYLKPDDFQPFLTWSGPYDGMMVDSGAMVQSFPAISADWFTQGAFEQDPGEPIRDVFYLIVAGYGSKNAVSYVWRVDRFCMPVAVTAKDKKARAIANNAVTPINGIGGSTNSLSRGVQIVRAPSGAVLAVYCEYDQPSESNAIIKATMFVPNTSLPASGKTLPNDGISNPVWKGSIQFGTVASICRPYATFVGTQVEKGKTPTLKNSKGATQVFPNSIMQREVMFVFCGQITSSTSPPFPLQFFSAYYGLSVTIQQAQPLAPKSKSSLVLCDVADTFPYPNPAASVWDGSSPSGMVDWTACKYDYLVGNQAESEVEIEVKSVYGAKAGMKTTAGLGPMIEAAISGGARATQDTSKSRYNATVLSVLTKGQTNPTTGTANETTTLGVRPQGAYVARGYPSVSVSYSFFADRDGTVHAIPSIPMYMGLRLSTATSPVSASGEYQTYCYTPGDLNSYYPDNVNTTMRNLFNALSSDAKAAFTIGGKDYSNFYTDPNKSYLDHVVDAFGAKCFGASGKLSYLEFSFGSTENQRSEYQETSALTQASSVFFDSSLYAGLSSGGKISFAGVELAGAESYVAVGLELGASYTWKSSSTASWGLSLADYLNPLAPEESYTVRMYFFKPSRLWAREMQYFGFTGTGMTVPANIDFNNSAPTRFLFTVPTRSPTLNKRMQQAFPLTPVPPD